MSDAAARPDVAGFLAMLAASDAPPLASLTPDAARAGMRANVALADAPPVVLARIEDCAIPGPAGRLPARLYDRRASRSASPLILFFHGGGFVLGDLDTHHGFCSWLADTLDLPLLAIDYRLAPEHPFPAAPDDAEAAARWIAQEPDAFGFRVTGLIPCGDSAGGNLAIVTTQQLALRPAALPVRACWALYPYVGGGKDWASFRDFGSGHFIEAADMAWFDDHYAAPSGDPRHDCLYGPVPPVPLVIHMAGMDPLRDGGRAYATRVAAAGHPVQRLEAAGMIHGFIQFRRAIPSAMDDCRAFAVAARATLATG